MILILCGASLVRFCMCIGMSRFVVCVNRNPNCSTWSSTNNRTILTTEFIANCRAGSTTIDTATNGCVLSGSIRVCFNNHQRQ